MPNARNEPVRRELTCTMHPTRFRTESGWCTEGYELCLRVMDCSHSVGRLLLVSHVHIVSHGTEGTGP